jgi:hypothetical protein
MSSKRLLWRIVRRWYLILKAAMPTTLVVVEYVDEIYSFYRTSEVTALEPLQSYLWYLPSYVPDLLF